MGVTIIPGLCSAGHRTQGPVQVSQWYHGEPLLVGEVKSHN